MQEKTEITTEIGGKHVEIELPLSLNELRKKGYELVGFRQARSGEKYLTFEGDIRTWCSNTLGLPNSTASYTLYWILKPIEKPKEELERCEVMVIGDNIDKQVGYFRWGITFHLTYAPNDPDFVGAEWENNNGYTYFTANVKPRFKNKLNGMVELSLSKEELQSGCYDVVWPKVVWFRKREHSQ